MITDREQKLRKALEWLINLREDAINRDGDYCREFCPVRDKAGYCPAETVEEYFDAELDHWTRDYKKCMELQVDYYTEKANE